MLHTIRRYMCVVHEGALLFMTFGFDVQMIIRSFNAKLQTYFPIQIAFN
jgi:hypothetical protein